MCLHKIEDFVFYKMNRAFQLGNSLLDGSKSACVKRMPSYFTLWTEHSGLLNSLLNGTKCVCIKKMSSYFTV